MAQEKNYILKGNLELALELAIAYRSKQERSLMYDRDSAQLSGWKQNLEALRKGTLEIR